MSCTDSKPVASCVKICLCKLELLIEFKKYLRKSNGINLPWLAPSLPAGRLLTWDAHPCELVDFFPYWNIRPAGVISQPAVRSHFMSFELYVL